MSELKSSKKGKIDLSKKPISKTTPTVFVPPRKSLLRARDIRIEEMKEILPPEEGVDFQDFGEDELETLESEFTVFDLEPCFPIISEIIVNLDTLEVEALTPPPETLSNSFARRLVKNAKILAVYLQDELQKIKNSNTPIIPDLFEKKFLTRSPDIEDNIWRNLRESIYITLYLDGEPIKTLLLKEITAPKGRPPEQKKEAFLKKVLQKYPFEEFAASLRNYAKHIYENEEEAREYWGNFDTFRKYIERNIKNKRRKEVHE